MISIQQIRRGGKRVTKKFNQNKKRKESGTKKSLERISKNSK